jgi:hypothetical protein
MGVYTSPPKDKDELLTWIEKEWDLLQNTIRGLDESQMSIPDEDGWSIKDNLAHLGEWERYLVLNHLRRIPPHEVMGIAQDQFAAMNEDGLNAILFERNKERTTTEIMEMLQNSHTQVLEELAGWSFADLMKPRFENGDPSLSIGMYVAGNTYLHYREHRETIEKWKTIARRG